MKKPDTYAWTATGMRASTAAPTLFVKEHELPELISKSLEDKLATMLNYEYELRADRQPNREKVFRSMLDDPEIAGWLDKMKAQGRVNFTRFS